MHITLYYNITLFLYIYRLFLYRVTASCCIIQILNNITNNNVQIHISLGLLYNIVFVQRLVLLNISIATLKICISIMIIRISMIAVHCKDLQIMMKMCPLCKYLNRI
jgi:hypothetical protein